ncbi:ATP-binding protein [Streptosporangium longisporum]|uniref:Histidine kinase/HSP90-like ATPase domain-containing protein n=1 Tax=Streptosporangium longisporum TaxID=46187 RepID=A0ABN3Y1E0_9ACTN
MGDGSGADIARVTFPISGDLASLRAKVRAFLVRAEFDEVTEKNFVLALSEAANNVLDHSGGTGTLTMRHLEGRVVAEIHDDAGLLIDPHAGMKQPPVGSRRGYGIWLMRTLCDSVEILHDPGGSTVRLTMLLPH